MVVSYELLDEIDRKKKAIDQNPNYYLWRSNRIKRNLRGICNVHSYWLENPELREQILGELELESQELQERGIEGHKSIDEQGVRGIRILAKEGIQRVGEAWDFLSKYSNKENKFAYLNSNAILNVGRLIDPKFNNRGFRKIPVEFSGLDYIVPPAIRVPELVDQFCYDVRNSDIHPVEAAAMTHLTLGGIQPFDTGNKRVSRLFQDQILHEAGLPPAFIPAGERTVYVDLFNQALTHQGAHQLEYQTPFFDYIGSKVNVALDKILGDLKI